MLRKKNLIFPGKIGQLLTSPFESFFKFQSSGGVVLLLVSIAAIIIANSGLASFYFKILNLKLSISVGSWSLEKSLLLWINDGLMTVFFFLIGLEIKREILVGELSSFKQALVPVFAAIGGMIVPATFYLTLNNEPTFIDGWAIPMTTDIAFSLGILTMLGKKVPASLKIFLLAFAIIDDLGAVMIIAFYYSGQVNFTFLFISLFILAFLLMLNYLDYRIIGVYVFIGLIMWYFMLKSGLHPTLTGVIVAFTIPAKRKINLHVFQEKLKNNIAPFSKPCGTNKVLLNKQQIEAIDNIETAIQKVQSPLQSLEHHLNGFVVYVVMPVFAFANAGIVFKAGIGSLTEYLSLIIAFSLVFGKVIGIMSFTAIAVYFRFASFSKGITWGRLLGISFLGGIGFTMSIFIAGLAFSDAQTLNSAKIGILIGSLFAGIVGYLILKYMLKKDVENNNGDSIQNSAEC